MYYLSFFFNIKGILKRNNKFQQTKKQMNKNILHLKNKFKNMKKKLGHILELRINIFVTKNCQTE